MSKKRTYYPRTTASQRKRLFEEWEATMNVKHACRIARVSERTFYYWKPRFSSGGYPALEEFEKHGTKNPVKVAKDIEQKVINHRKHHPTLGKRRIADELAKANNWVPVVSPNTVRRILIDAGLWSKESSHLKKKGA